MNLEQKLQHYRSTYNVLATVELDHWHTLKPYQRDTWLRNTLKTLRQDSYESDQRIVFTLESDEYVDNDPLGLILRTLQIQLNEVDITNFFVVVLLNQSADIDAVKEKLTKINLDSTSITLDQFESTVATERVQTTEKKGYRYNSTDPIGVDVDSLSDREGFLLTESKTFCMYPWIHLHAFPTGEAYPCCFSKMEHPIGSVKTHTLKELWNSPEQKQLRVNMLSEQPSEACKRCYEQEESGFFSGRRSANKHHGKQIDKIKETLPDGHVDRFELTYWDIRFSNLCNLKCRSCGHIFSTQWYQDQAKLAGPEWKLQNQVLNYAGRTETDMWEQLEPHLDYVEQIYFAGGEPLLMEEHYNILKELVKRKRFDVRLTYNTNFTHTELKGESVFDYWKQFDRVAIGASLDAMGPQAEYIRKGTDWAVVEQNRRDMLQICPEVDFYISPTLSIMNAWHLPDFHKDWVEKGLLKPQDLNVNILQGPVHYRIDIAPAEYKAALTQRFNEHIDWLQSQGDPLGRATQGFESAIAYMNATDNTHLIDTFWRKTHELDSIRDENILTVLPELRALK
jgi:radical SAM protein with 4Fe4S-binding SPASM domain